MSRLMLTVAEPTWEPASSFDDPAIIEEYERRVGMRDASDNDRMQL